MTEERDLHAASYIYMEDENGVLVKAYKRRNPDGSQGGFVAETATVHSTAIINIHAEVRPGAVVEAYAVVKADFCMLAGRKTPILDNHFDP